MGKFSGTVPPKTCPCEVCIHIHTHTHTHTFLYIYAGERGVPGAMEEKEGEQEVEEKQEDEECG